MNENILEILKLYCYPYEDIYNKASFILTDYSNLIKVIYDGANNKFKVFNNIDKILPGKESKKNVEIQNGPWCGKFHDIDCGIYWFILDKDIFNMVFGKSLDKYITTHNREELMQLGKAIQFADRYGGKPKSFKQCTKVT